MCKRFELVKNRPSPRRSLVHLPDHISLAICAQRPSTTWCVPKSIHCFTLSLKDNPQMLHDIIKSWFSYNTVCEVRGEERWIQDPNSCKSPYAYLPSHAIAQCCPRSSCHIFYACIRKGHPCIHIWGKSFMQNCNICSEKMYWFFGGGVKLERVNCWTFRFCFMRQKNLEGSSD